MRRYTKHIGSVLLATGFLLTACDGKDGGVQGGDKEVAALEPKELCELSATDGKAPQRCTESMEMVKMALGDEDWKAFSICAQTAKTLEEAQACTTDEMKVKIDAAKKKAYEAEHAARVLKRLQDDLAELTTKHEAGEDITVSCASAMSPLKADSNLTLDDPAVEALTTLCTYTTPLAKLEATTRKAEAARAADPEKVLLPECLDADYSLSLKALEDAGKKDDEKVAAVIARFETVCPPKK